MPKRSPITITTENHVEIRAHLHHLTDTFQCNMERWVLDRLEAIPQDGSAASIQALQTWVDLYMTPVMRERLLAWHRERNHDNGASIE
ncbi:MAG: hypothetical protein HQL50_09470 [Magnetococcales bacterium]|nr:hypothetical protein [Magnetococcales bacterium]